MVRQISWKIGGQQGEGIESAGDLLAQGLSWQGYHLYGYRVFSSRIRGGHTDYNLRMSSTPIASIADSVDVLFALDQETIALCAHELSVDGWIIADELFAPILPEGTTARLMIAPLTALATQAGNAKMKNVVAIGLTAAMLGISPAAFEAPLRDRFHGKGETIIQANLTALRSGWECAEKTRPEIKAAYQLDTGDGVRRLYMIGNEAISRGAIAAGAKLMAAYPITPASEIMEAMVERLPKLGGSMIQTEDEIAACMMAIGANYAGVRAFTATSGPGLSLMAESIGLAGMTETPLVVIDVQRGGPSTGLPTKHEQSDIMAAIFSTHGEAPKIVMAPDSTAAAYPDTVEAFNLAEEYQCPVILLSDMQLSLGMQTMALLPTDGASMRRGNLKSVADLPELAKNQYFKRYQVTPDGVSPRVIPGMKNGIHHVTGLEHDETGRPFEGVTNRIAQTDKRLRKLSTVVGRFPEPLRTDTRFAKSELLIIGVGASSGPIAEAVLRLRQEGATVNHVQVRLLHPFPAEKLQEFLDAAKTVVVVEHNATAQLASLIRANSSHGREIHSVLKYDGNPFRPEEIVNGCREVL
ncbi:MAG TPA: 2-oxoacid:acceptor oxidoreductase subunit alpha [Negativicutes bacterium]|nr:2-oxoacid:acceptor oxidoreductase subunit alpha [Negativicutes bacterium]